MAFTTDTTVIAAFRNSADAQAAAQDLQAAGIPRENIFLEAQAGGQSAAGSQTGTGANLGTRSTHHEGGVSGWFKSLFQDDQSDDRAGYERAIGSGNFLLSVDAGNEQVDTIETILNRHSPLDVHSDGGNTAATPAVGSTGASTTPRTGVGNAEAIPVVQEEMQVGKRRVLRGGVRVYSRLVETPVQESVNLQEEHVHVDRTRVDRPATAADLAGGTEQVIEMQEFAEQPVVSKQARVVEEVRVGKEVTDRTENITGTVRHTEVEVEPAINSGAGVTSPYDSEFRNHFQSQAGGTGTYDDYSPAYNYGYQSASDPRYKGRSFDDVENDLRSDYSRRYPNSTWDKMKDSVRYGWNKVTGKV